MHRCMVLPPQNFALGLISTGIYPHKPNFIAETEFSQSCISDQSVQQRSSTPFHNTPQQKKNNLSVSFYSLSKNILSLSQPFREVLPAPKITIY